MHSSSPFPPHESNNGNHANTGAVSGKLIELIPVDHHSFAKRLAKWVQTLVRAALAIVLIFILVRLLVAGVVALQISDAVGRSAMAAGLDASITAWLKTVASLGLGLGMAGLVMRALLGSLFPVGNVAAGSWKPLTVLVAVSGIGTALPVGIQHARGVDEAGLPAVMREVDPAKATWFNPEGAALIYFADHLDGSRRFWNRPGHTPNDNTEAGPVTAQIHGEWLRQQLVAQREEMAARQAEEAARVEEARQVAAAAAEQAERERQQRAHEEVLAQLRLQMQQLEAQQAAAERAKAQAEAQQAEAARQLADTRRAQEEVAASQREEDALPKVRLQELEASSTRAATSGIRDEAPAQRFEQLPTLPASAQEFPLRRGMTLNIPVRGDRVEIWSDGPVEVSADQFAFRSLPLPGHRMRFLQGAQTVHVRPSGPAASRVFLRKIQD